MEMGFGHKEIDGYRRRGAAPSQNNNSSNSHQCGFILAYGAELRAVLSKKISQCWEGTTVVMVRGRPRTQGPGGWERQVQVSSLHQASYGILGKSCLTVPQFPTGTRGK